MKSLRILHVNDQNELGRRRLFFRSSSNSSESPTSTSTIDYQSAVEICTRGTSPKSKEGQVVYKGGPPEKKP